MWTFCVCALVTVILVSSESSSDENVIVYPRFLSLKYSQRLKRESASNNVGDFNFIEIGDMLIALEENDKIAVSDDFEEDGDFKEGNETTKCKFYTGKIVNNVDNNAVLTFCDGLVYYALIERGDKIYVLEPTSNPKRAHVLYKSSARADKGPNENDYSAGRRDLYRGIGPQTIRKEDYGGRSVMNNSSNKNANKGKRCADCESDVITYNLDGDTIGDTLYKFSDDDDDNDSVQDDPNVHMDGMEARTLEDIEYFQGPTILTRPLSADEVLKGSKSTAPRERWLELAVALDRTLIEFYGIKQAKQYIMALMNIVSAIYKDSSLGANLNIVISRMYFYRDKRHLHVRRYDARKSLETVNRWNHRITSTLKPGAIPHDAALWLTREELGGPSGYAPVSGVCDSTRSTALAKDEGLTSAFVIAHELGHVLGLTHDSDSCRSEAKKGSVMATVVAATFRRFTWSSCSKNELQKSIKKWKCLLNKPNKSYMDNLLQSSAVLRQSMFTYSMDEQCRMEFGEGYTLCRSFELIEPCAHLWCGHLSTPFICKTKKVVPLDGTQCGHGKWCIDGLCQKVDKKLINWMSNMNDRYPTGEWSDWSKWSDCITYKCGRGVRFRTRKCQNIRKCKGQSEEITECIPQKKCSESIMDPRANQCKLIPDVINNRQLITRNGIWLPYAMEEVGERCKLNCVNWVTEDVIFTGDNVADGARCNYDDENNICIKGKCKQLQCKQPISVNSTNAVKPELNETVSIDAIDYCGVCGGNSSTCQNRTYNSLKILKRDLTRVFELPKMSRRISVSVEVSSLGNNTKIVHYHMFRLVLEDSRKNQYHLTDKNWKFVSVTSSSLRDNLPPVISRDDKHIILEGARFEYHHSGNVLLLRSVGPVQKDVTIYVYSPQEYYRSIQASTTVNYTLESNDIVPDGKYKWSFSKGSRGICSSSCGGGMRNVKPACMDSETNRTVAHRKCSTVNKPLTIFEECNNFSCSFHWVLGEWENCNKTCGPKGFAHREVYCLPSDISSTYEVHGRSINEPWRNMVAPSLCGKESPETEWNCNRIPCPTYWIEEPWTPCSATCGQGFSYRPLHCPAPASEAHFACGPRPPHQRRPCYGPPCAANPQTPCKRADTSPYCQLAGTARYCVLPTFKKMCCDSCRDFVQYDLEKID